MARRTKKAPEPTTANADFPWGNWEHILTSLEEGIVIIDCTEQVVFFNQAAEQLAGLSRGQVWRRSYVEVFAANSWMVEVIRRALVSGHSRAAGEGDFAGRSPRATPVRLTCSPVFDDKGVVSSLIVVLHDLSHQKELAEEIERDNLLTQVGVIAAGLAHEMKNPLAGIRGAAQLLQGRVSNDPSAFEYTTVMIREIDRLTQLLSQFLELSTPAPLELEPTNVHKVLTEVLLLEAEATPSGVKVMTQFDPSLPNVLGDETGLAQVFRNLIKNGVQALTGRRGGVFSIATRMATAFHIVRSPVTSERNAPLSNASYAAVPGISLRDGGDSAWPQRGRFLSIDFADNGPGIASEHLSRLFTPFFTTKGQGTGLGLAISQHIVAQHGGMIRVESAPGQGTVFHVYLPVRSV